MTVNAYIIAGPNGAGKTTFAREFLPQYARCREFLNADLLAAGLSPFAPDAAAMAAGRLLVARMEELVHQKREFGFETILAGKTYGSILQGMKTAGYALHLFYLWLPIADLAVARVANRVQQGGHDVPEPVIRRRFEAGLRNLVRLYLSLFDSWRIFDSSRLRPRMIAAFTARDLVVVDADLYGRIFQWPSEPMHREPSDQDILTRQAEAALKKAAQKAVEQARRTSGRVVIWRQDAAVVVPVDQLLPDERPLPVEE